MSVFRIHKNDNYTVISNVHLRDMNLSLKAKGLLSVMLSLPEDWDYSINGLCSILKENRTAIKSALDELKEFNYVKVIKKSPNETSSGRFEYEYNIYETPYKELESEELDTEKQYIENLYLENRIQLNTNKLNTNNLEKESEKKETYFDNPEVNDVYLEFLDMRKQMKVKNTPTSIKRQVNELNKLSDIDKIKCIEKSINCGWRGIFATKTPQAPKDDWFSS